MNARPGATSASVIRPFRERPLLGAAMLVLATVLFRWSLEPWMEGQNAYSVFYPAVIFSAYAFGLKPAALAAILSGFCAYWLFVQPSFMWKGGVSNLSTLAFFLMNCSVATGLVTALLKAVDRIALKQERAEALARSHADLFLELNERVSNHLQLVAGVLALQAGGEPERRVSEALADASERSILLARIHREFSGRTDEQVEFATFASRLTSAALASRGVDAGRVIVEESDLRMPSDQATSLGVALLECVNLLLSRQRQSQVRISFEADAGQTVVRLSDVDPTSGVSVASLSGGYLLRAMVAQLGGRIAISPGAAGASLEVILPRTDLAGNAATPHAALTLH